MVKRTRFQQALVDMDACAPGRRFVGELSLHEFWRKSLKRDPEDNYGYRAWLMGRLEDAGQVERNKVPCTCSPGCTYMTWALPIDFVPTMKQVIAAAKYYRCG